MPIQVFSKVHKDWTMAIQSNGHWTAAAKQCYIG